MHEDRIDRIELHHIHIPLPTPLFPVWTHGHAVTHLAQTLLTLTTKDGLVASAAGPAIGEERSGLGEVLGPFLMGLDPFDVDAARERLRQSSYLGWRNNWVDIAFWDLAAQARQIPLHQLIAERLDAGADTPAPEFLPAMACFQEHRPPVARAEAVERALRVGFRHAQVGLRGETEAEDVAQLEAARTAAGADAVLSVHAHQAWSVSVVRPGPRWDLDRALRTAEAAERAGYARMQEPLHEEMWESLEALTARTQIPIAGGDLAVSASQLRNLARLSVYDELTPSSGLAGIGRLEIAMKAALRYDKGFSPMAFGGGLELLANLHAQAAWSRLKPGATPRFAFPWEPPVQLPEYRDALLDSPLDIDGFGRLKVPTAPGIGARICPKALKRYGTKFYELTPVRLMRSSARTAGMRQTKVAAGRTLA